MPTSKVLHQNKIVIYVLTAMQDASLLFVIKDRSSHWPHSVGRLGYLFITQESNNPVHCLSTLKSFARAMHWLELPVCLK